VNIARTKSEAQLRAAIASAEASALQELQWGQLCKDPKNIEWRRKTAEIYREVAADYRYALAEHLFLDSLIYHPMPERIQ